MSERFRAFSFVDRITRCTPGVRVEGIYTVPPHVTRFPNSLMAEAVGQLAAWSAMARLDFAWRPVAGLAAECRYHHAAAPGAVLALEANIERCDPEAVAYSGRASIDGHCAVELVDCVGPMLPMEEFDEPEAVRSDFETLSTNGVAAGRFTGVPMPHLTTVEHAPGRRVRANLRVPQRTEAAYFDDHFPRRPVFPGTLLMDAFAQLAVPLARERPHTYGDAPFEVRNVSHVKIRSFTAPGAELELDVELLDATPQRARMKLAAKAEGKAVAGARMELGVGGLQ
jgi:3-hydroxymyristoyl/3-hydroxydecanoyl-(acyl carrier protein) dehydratase